MRGYKLTDEISIPELLKMRESGTSNSEIAESLDVSYKTICNYLGKGGPRRQTRRALHVPERTAAKDEPVQACLKMEPSEIRLTGAYGKYAFAPDGDSISVIIDGDYFFSVPRDQLSTFIRELQAIERNIGKVKTQLEVW